MGTAYDSPLPEVRWSRNSTSIVQKNTPETGGIIFTFPNSGSQLHRVTPAENLRAGLDRLDLDASYFSFESWPMALERVQRCAWVRANLKPKIRD